MTTTTDLMAPLHGYHQTRGRTVCPTRSQAKGWMCYGAGKLIQWDDRQADGWSQNGHTSHYTVTSRYGSTPRAVSSVRPIFLRPVTVPFRLSGWVRIDHGPQNGNSGFKVSFLHNSNMDNWLWQAMRGNRTGNLWQESRHGSVYDPKKQPYGIARAAQADFPWKIQTTYPWELVVERDRIRGYIEDMDTPKVDYTVPKGLPISRSGQVGFRLDGAVVHFGSLVLTEGN